MKQLLTLIGESFNLLMGNLVLSYPFLLFLLVAPALVPQTPPEPELRWFFLMAVLVLFYAGFIAGWSNMIAEATRKSCFPEPVQNQPESDIPRIPNVFGLFKHFIPGVGEYYFQMLVGVVIQFAVFALFVWWVVDNMDPSVTTFFERLVPPEQVGSAPVPPVNPQQIIDGMSPRDKSALEDFASMTCSALFGYGVFHLMTMFWQPLVILGKHNVLQAYVASIRQFFRDPIRLVVTGLLFVIFYFVLSTLMGLMPVLEIIWHLLSLLASMAFTVFLFVYVVRVMQIPKTDEGPTFVRTA